MTKMLLKFGVHVEILGGICNCADLCKKRGCPYRKFSAEATRQYCRLLVAEIAGEQVEKNQPPEYCPLKGTIIFD